MADLQPRNVLITGGASGLGLGIARALAASGARVIVADFDSKAGEGIEQELRNANHTVKFIHVDVTSIYAVAAMLRDTLAWLPDGEAIDAAILSAGINGNPFDLTPGDPSALSQPEAFQTVMRNAATVNVNLTAVLQCVQLIVKFAMGLSPPASATPQSSDAPQAKATAKSITLIGSAGSYRALPRAVDYSASKWGVRGIFRSLRQQLPKIGVRVNMVAPGFVKTPLLAAAVPMYEQMGVRFVKEADVVQAVVSATTDATCSGRSFAVTSQGIVDLQDEAAGMDASTILNGLVAGGALGSESCPMGHDEQAVRFS